MLALSGSWRASDIFFLVAATARRGQPKTMGTIKNRLNLLLSALGRSAAAPERGNRHMAVKPLLSSLSQMERFLSLPLPISRLSFPLHAPPSGSWAALCLGLFPHSCTMALFLPRNQQMALISALDKGPSSWVWQIFLPLRSTSRCQQLSSSLPWYPSEPWRAQANNDCPGRSDRKPSHLCPLHLSMCQPASVTEPRYGRRSPAVSG